MMPEISFVVAARNDDYGGNFLYRMQIFLNALLAQWLQYDLHAELVIVEWNPPKDKMSLQKVLTWPDMPALSTVRIITVPNKVHLRLPNADRTPMFEYIAKNIGIRRATGKFIIATNPDILFSDALMGFIASKKLSDDAFYRVDRYDVSLSIPIDLPLKEQLRFCKRNTSRINTLGISVTLNSWLPFILREWFARCLILLQRQLQLRRKVRIEDTLHTNASGDFMLMSRDVWFSLKSYPQLETMSHIDSYMCCMAASIGVKQVILASEMRVYHQGHHRGSTSSRPMTSYEVWTRECERMLRERRPLIKNDDTWGLADTRLAEIRKSTI
jgi:hypothetical protein